MKAIIMAGGTGTRLLPLTANMPKPLAKLCGKPVCKYILELLKEHNCKDATFTLMHQGEKIEHEFETGSFNGIKLNFSYEDKPLGTAGCVKKAAKAFIEPFIVISGDALCDFNLSAAYDFHLKNNADATIIVKRVSDPREFGLVNSVQNKIVGFQEKPSYLGCVNDVANTGIYILSPKVLDLIPEDSFCDFARDVFPKMLAEKMSLMSYEESGYWCDIGDLISYRECQSDMLLGKVKCHIDGEKTKVGSYTQSKLQSNFRAVLPYYIGKNVSIGDGTIIKAGTIIGDNVTIGENCHITSSVILDGCFISDNVSCTGAIICQNVSLKSNSAIYENAVIGDNTIIGKSCVVNSNIKIWCNKEIEQDTTVNQDVEFGSKSRYELDENGFSGETNITATPQFMSILGGAIGTAIKDRIIVSHNNNQQSETFADSLIGGISAAGSDVINCESLPLPLLVHQCRVTNSSILVYVSVGAITKVTILNKGGLPLTRQQERSIEGYLNRGGIAKAYHNRFGAITKATGCISAYTGMLERISDFKSRYNIQLDCNNKMLLNSIKPIFSKISNTDGKNLIVTLSCNGTKGELFSQETGQISCEKLLLINCLDMIEMGVDVALPHSVLFDMENISENYQTKTHRFFSCSNDNSDFEARKIAEKQPFLIDGAVLVLSALAYAEKHNLALDALIAGLPVFESEKRYLKVNCPSPQILKQICENNNSFGEGVFISKNNDKILLRSNKSGNGLYMYAQSMSAETAKNLCDDLETQVRNMMMKIDEEKR